VRVKKKPTVPSEAALAPGLRRYLYLTAAITGGSIMIVEILGAKMLSPYLGTSHFVWTAQIAITLVALACGYYAGGWLVDRALRLGRMYAGILAAGLYLALTLTIYEPVAYACLKFDLAFGSLLASTFLFFVPLSLLAMVGPFFVRVLTSSVAGVGGNVGRLSSISTFGSFIGTVLIGYVVIPYLPNSLSMYFTALLLFLVSGLYFVIWGRSTNDRTPAIVAIALGGAIGYLSVRAQAWETDDYEEIFRGNSNFGLLQVIQQKEGTQRNYLNDYLTQNTYDIVERKSISMFTYMLHGLAHTYAPKLEDVLCIGMGIGIVPMEFARDGCRVDCVEINPAVVPVAQKFFDFDPSRINLIIADGRYVVNQSKKQYDAIILDAFLGDSCPSHLMTREAFTAMRRILRPEAVLVINTFADLDGERDFFGASLYKTLTNVFSSVRIHAGRNGNTLFVASQRPQLAFVRQPNLTNVYSGCLGLVQDAYTRLREPGSEHGRILTDDHNPVEFYDAASREDLRKRLADHFRSQ
jgi:spermidine synthase